MKELYVVWTDDRNGYHCTTFSQEEVDRYLSFKGIINDKTIRRYFEFKTGVRSYRRSYEFDNGFNTLISWQWQEDFTSEQTDEFYKTYEDYYA